MKALTGKNSVAVWCVRLVCCHLICATAAAEDRSQWGERYTRNMVSGETGLPDTFDPATGKNIKWAADLGSQNYASPIISGGKVLIGANNDLTRDPRHEGDRGVLLCLNEADGSLRWQLVVPKLEDDPYLDWPKAGMVSPPTVEGDRVYMVTNRAEVVCLDLKGLADGNAGPYQDEGRHMTPRGAETMEPGKMDADIVWLFDMRARVGMHPHDETHSSILLHGDFLYVSTGNGNDNTHRLIRAPEAPSLIVLDKKTGRLLARDDERIGPRIFHSTWSSPALGKVGDQTLVFFGGGDGVCYAFEALRTAPPADAAEVLRRIWRFDCDPSAPKEEVHAYIGNRRESPSNIKGMPVFHGGLDYVAAGGDIWWGKKEAWLKCIDASKTGDITGSGEIWSYPLERHCCSTPAIHDGLVFITDCGGMVHCLDAETGRPHWTQKTKGEIWASPLVADGKVYVGTRRSEFWIFAASKTKAVLASIALDSPVSGVATPANGVLYVPTMQKLYAVAKDTE